MLKAYRIFYIFQATLFGIFLYLSSGCKPTKPPPVPVQTYELRLQAPTGNVAAVYEVDMDVKAQTGREIENVSIKTRMDFQLEVVEKPTDTVQGKAKCRFSRVAYDMGGKTLASDMEKVDDPRLASLLSELKRLTTDIVLDVTYDRDPAKVKLAPVSEQTLNQFNLAKSILSPFTQGQESGLADMFVGNKAMLPSHPVKLGDSWEAAGAGNPNLPPELNVATVVTLDSVVQEGKDTIACLKAKSSAKVNDPRKMRKPDGKVITINKGTIESETTTYFNITQQREESTTSTVRTVMEIPHPQGGGLTITSDTEIKIRTKRIY